MRRQVAYSSRLQDGHLAGVQLAIAHKAKAKPIMGMASARRPKAIKHASVEKRESGGVEQAVRAGQERIIIVQQWHYVVVEVEK